MLVTLQGTHEGGDFTGFEPTGRTFEVPNIVITRIEVGEIAERWRVADSLFMMERSGAVEPADESGFGWLPRSRSNRKYREDVQDE